MNKRLDIATGVAVDAGSQASPGSPANLAPQVNSRRVVLPDARRGLRGRARRMIDRPWNGLPTVGRTLKRLMDIGVSAALLLFLSPLFLMAAAAILVTSGRPIFFQQQRVGRGGQIFHMYKFRSMRNDAERDTGPIWASDHDTRCTRIGDWLRHTNIDELPQIFNVLRGDMSLVGPRPERPIFVEEFRQTVPGYDLRHAVPGGMTGWAQVHGWRGRTSLRKRIQYDLDYIERWSVGLDIRVLFMTVQHVFWGRTTWNDAKRPAPTEE